eukprot:TRINITY_DN2339_c0_g5_i1.p1 TRINITY_DN2339_c0_g5~~TRINITY_DN2339_c0_g5_i1.p1  ORF type:complete len:280 (-),score=43.59 TRINITY_DN2339_c0_g5_i1:93-932(-)
MNSIYERSVQDFNIRKTAFDMALEKSLRLDDSELLAMFMKYGGNPNVQFLGRDYSMNENLNVNKTRFPIHVTANNRNPVFLRLLLESGSVSNVDQVHTSELRHFLIDKRSKSETALHIACQNNLIENVILLLKYGANVNVEKKWTDWVYVENKQTTEELQERIRSWSTLHFPVVEYPIHIAIKSKNSHMVALLSSFGANTQQIYKYGEETKTCVELCSGDKSLLTALREGWNPSIHKYYPQEVKDAIRTFLLCVKHLRIDNSVFPRDSQMDICRYIANR